MDVKYYHYSHFPDGKPGPRGAQELVFPAGPGVPASHLLPSSLRAIVSCSTSSSNRVRNRNFHVQGTSASPYKHPSFPNSRGLSGGERQTLQKARGWEGPQSRLPCPPRAHPPPPVPRHLAPTGDQQPPQLGLLLQPERFMAPKPAPSASGTWFCSSPRPCPSLLLPHGSQKAP